MKAEELIFKGNWPDDEIESEPWETFTIRLYGQEAGDYVDDPSDVVHTLKRAGLQIVSTDAIQQTREEALARVKELCDCLEDVATGKGGWAWEEVLQEGRALIERDGGE